MGSGSKQASKADQTKSPSQAAMDSGNSCSLQSSSGADDEYDSRAGASETFINHHPMSSNPPPPLAPFHHHNQTTLSSSMFDPLSNYFDPISRPHQNPPSSLLNLDMVWPNHKTFRSDPNPTSEISPLLGQQPFLSPSTGLAPSTVPFPPVNINNAATSSTATSDNHNKPPIKGRNTKKRSRASRRAPTTVLTTDTTNFRAMVQEFTGIPAPPFTSTARGVGRLDLFGIPSLMRSTPLSLVDTSSQQQPPYSLLRPFAQKIQPPPPFSNNNNSAFVDSNDVISGSASGGGASNLATTSSGFLLNMQNQNPILSFQSLLQAQPKYPVSSMGSKNQGPSSDVPRMSGVVDHEFGHGLLPNLISHGTAPTGPTQPRMNQNEDNNPTLWRQSGGGVSPADNGGYNFSRNGNFQSNKGPENNNVSTTRGEGGMMESWICSSDN